MPSLAQQAIMLEALSGESDWDMPGETAAYREEAERNPDKWKWCIAEAQRRALERTDHTRLEKAVHEAAVKWCGEKERETFPEDIAYFEHNWRSFRGFQERVQQELSNAASATDDIRVLEHLALKAVEHRLDGDLPKDLQRAIDREWERPAPPLNAAPPEGRDAARWASMCENPLSPGDDRR